MKACEEKRFDKGVDEEGEAPTGSRLEEDGCLPPRAGQNHPGGGWLHQSPLLVVPVVGCTAPEFAWVAKDSCTGWVAGCSWAETTTHKTQLNHLSNTSLHGRLWRERERDDCDFWQVISSPDLLSWSYQPLIQVIIPIFLIFLIFLIPDPSVRRWLEVGGWRPGGKVGKWQEMVLHTSPLSYLPPNLFTRFHPSSKHLPFTRFKTAGWGRLGFGFKSYLDNTSMNIVFSFVYLDPRWANSVLKTKHIWIENINWFLRSR